MRKLLLPAILLLSANSYAQSNLKYSDEGFNTKAVEQSYHLETPGQLFTKRMNSLYSQAEASAYTRITRENYADFLKIFENLMGRTQNATITQNLSVLAAIMNSVNDNAYNNDQYRNDIYHMAVPVYKAVHEEWGDEVIHISIINAYFKMKEYVALKAVDDTRMRTVTQFVNDNAVKAGSTETCLYKVWVSPNLNKDDIEIYFSDAPLYAKLAQRYPEDFLLTGPVLGWESKKEESSSIRNILKTYASAPKQSGYSVYAYDMAPDTKTKTLDQPLSKDNKWYMWVFRNGVLYYSYMAEPCSPINRAQIK